MYQNQNVPEGLVVKKKNNERAEILLRKLKKKIKTEGTEIEYKERMYFTKPSEKRKLKRHLAILRQRQQQEEYGENN